VNLVDISGTNRRNIWKLELMNIKNISYLYMGINDFNKGYQPTTNIVKDEKSEFGYRLPQYFG